jgi:H3 lysine-79-specific histone-lysine N-methyltransferase
MADTNAYGSYQLVYASDELDPVEEIMKVVKNVGEVYLAPDEAVAFTDENKGFNRRLQRARNMKNLDDFKAAVRDYNAAVQKFRDDGIFTRNLDNRHSLPLQFVECVLTQIYDRTVSPNVDSLRKYENGTDNVYGELLSPFVNDIFRETQLKSDQIFVDLGSGVGNVVLQAALQIGCESWGCEMMKAPCDNAEKQEKEFKARCRMWGLVPGKVKLLRSDFMVCDELFQTLRKADVVLVNNQAFTPDLNAKLAMLFLDLKDGCKVVSLKSFGDVKPHSKQYSILGNFSVTKKEYYRGYVSWTDAPGEYFIATKGNEGVSKVERESTDDDGEITKSGEEA